MERAEAEVVYAFVRDETRSVGTTSLSQLRLLCGVNGAGRAGKLKLYAVRWDGRKHYEFLSIILFCGTQQGIFRIRTVSDSQLCTHWI
jgi:hypothetical protein